ncbi:MAG TPA: MFS transporter [Candidatus Aquicultor sp.]
MATSSKKTFNDEETHIVDESLEVSMGESQFPKRFVALFPALDNRNYRFYFAGQLVSLIGTWLQIVAQGWLVLTLTNSAFLIGVIAALATVPALLFSLFGGVIVDRFPKRQILIFTQASSMILAFTLGILTVLGVIAVWEIGLLAFLLGSVNAIDSPARQAFVPEMVGKDVLPSAIALNSGTFNAARVIGPGIAGFLISVVGTGGAFIVNGLSYIAVIIALLAIHVEPYVPKEVPHPIKAIREGIAYSFTHPIIRTLLIFTGVISIFGWSYTTIMPVIARNIFHVGASGLGYLYMASGLGALVAVVLISAFSERVSTMASIIGGNTLFAVSLALFTFTSNFSLALVLLFFAGLGLIAQFSTVNTTIQNLVSDEVRGRVASIYVLMFIGLAPLGNFEIGWLAERAGTETALRVGAIIVFLFGILVLRNRQRVRTAYMLYRERT